VLIGFPLSLRNSVELATMFIQHLSPLASSLFSLLTITSLRLAFVMLGSRWLNNYLYAFAAESWIIAALSAAVGYYGG
jgi:hydrogenase-4 component E